MASGGIEGQQEAWTGRHFQCAGPLSLDFDSLTLQWIDGLRARSRSSSRGRRRRPRKAKARLKSASAALARAREERLSVER